MRLPPGEPIKYKTEMMHFKSICRCSVLACLAISAWASNAAETARVQSFAPDYFTQFQVNTALEMVDHLPGFTFDNGTALRGYSGALGNVLVDGKRPTSKTDSLWEFLSRIPASAVLRIDVINGSASDIDMQGQSTVANILLKPTDLTSASATVGSTVVPGDFLFPWIEGTYSLKRKDKSIDVYAASGTDPDVSQGSGHRTTWYAGRTLPAEMTFGAHGVSKGKALKINYAQDFLGGQLGWNGTVKPSIYRVRAQYDADAPSEVWNDKIGREFEQGIGYTHAVGKTSTMDLKALYRKSDSDFGSRFASGNDTSRYHSNTTAIEQIVVGQMNWQPVSNLVIRGGVESTVNTSDNRSSYEANGNAIALPSSTVRVQETRSESQLSSAWQASNTMNVEAGLRIERSNLSQRSDTVGEKAFAYSKPRVLLSLSPTQSLQLRLRLDREVSQLNFSDFVSSIGLLDKVVTAGNPDLVPSKTWLSEGTAEYHFWDKGAAVLTYTHSRIGDVIDRVPIRTTTAVYDAAGNIGDGIADSVTGQLNVPTDKWLIPQGLVKLTTTWKSSRVTDPTTLTARRLSGEQPMAWKVEFSQDLPRQKAGWGLSVDNGWTKENWQVSQRDYSNGVGWVKAFVNYRPAPKTTLALELDNLANRIITYDRTHYAGDRQTGSVDFVEHNETRIPPFAIVSLRQDW
jgi:hypothetical protein